MGICPVVIVKIKGTHRGDFPKAIEKGFKFVILFFNGLCRQLLLLQMKNIYDLKKYACKILVADIVQEQPAEVFCKKKCSSIFCNVHRNTDREYSMFTENIHRECSMLYSMLCSMMGLFFNYFCVGLKIW